MLNVCSLPSKLDLPDFIQFIESNTVNCFVETKINEIYVDNLSIPAGYKWKFKCRTHCSKVKSGGVRIIYKGQLEEFITEIKKLRVILCHGTELTQPSLDQPKIYCWELFISHQKALNIYKRLCF